MGIIESNGIYFVNHVLHGYVHKYGSSRNGDVDIEHLNFFKNADTLSEIISDVGKALAGEFDLINDPDLTNNIAIAEITPTEIVYYDCYGKDIIAKSSLEDFKEKAIAWRLFLQTPPFNGSRVRWWKRPWK
ncbi:hypothetical protein [Mucilaginibacter sp.]|uniref:hypothetical protein n=1 Tax=Mucilaginibacter sp. TaxID=1882438 RepID=UPI0032677D2F